MGRKTYFLVAGVIFALVAVSHALRIYMEWPVTIANWSVPKSVSWIALIVAGGLALFAFRFITENGAIAQQGSHDVLVQQDGLYRRLVERQFVAA